VSVERGRTVNRIIRRIGSAIQDLDIGISESSMNSNFLKQVNLALREVGGAPIKSLEEPGPLLRAAIALENSVDDLSEDA